MEDISEFRAAAQWSPYIEEILKHIHFRYRTDMIEALESLWMKHKADIIQPAAEFQVCEKDRSRDMCNLVSKHTQTVQCYLPVIVIILLNINSKKNKFGDILYGQKKLQRFILFSKRGGERIPKFVFLTYGVMLQWYGIAVTGRLEYGCVQSDR
jgi:hypothetical protein